jgi:hypothetical protein
MVAVHEEEELLQVNASMGPVAIRIADISAIALLKSERITR